MKKPVFGLLFFLGTITTLPAQHNMDIQVGLGAAVYASKIDSYYDFFGDNQRLTFGGALGLNYYLTNKLKVGVQVSGHKRSFSACQFYLPQGPFPASPPPQYSTSHPPEYCIDLEYIYLHVGLWFGYQVALLGPVIVEIQGGIGPTIWYLHERKFTKINTGESYTFKTNHRLESNFSPLLGGAFLFPIPASRQHIFFQTFLNWDRFDHRVVSTYVLLGIQQRL